MGMQIDAGRSSGKNSPKPNINVTPLVDVVLVLLIIFMVVLPNMQDGKAIEMYKASTAQKKQYSPDTIVITVARDGSAYWVDEPMTKDALAARVASIKSKHPDREILLRADKEAAYDDVRSWVTRLQGLKVAKVDLSVEVPKD